jgi:hypothetical protein
MGDPLLEDEGQGILATKPLTEEVPFDGRKFQVDPGLS